jgi:hypothetical protein
VKRLAWLSYDHILTKRDVTLNAENRRVMNAYRKATLRKHQASLVTQEDIFQADLELAELDRTLRVRSATGCSARRN